MDIKNRLPLHSLQWNQLGTFGVAPERLPVILKKLLEEPPNPTDPTVNELTNAIFHQYDLADATYFVFPYLIDIHARFANVTSYFFYLAANIAASANIDQIDLPPEFHRAFLESLIEFESVAISKLVTKEQPFHDVYNSCQAALAFSRHCCGKLLMDGLEQEQTKWTYLICSQCEERIRVMLFEAGIVIVEQGVEPEPPEPPMPLARPFLYLYDERQPNPWHVVESFISQESRLLGLAETERLHVELATRICALGFGPNVTAAMAFTLIGSILLTHGFPNSASRFFRLWDTIVCPKCKFSFVAGNGWWGCVI